MHASRFSRVMTNCVHALRLPSLCIVAQGAKTVIVGQETFEYDASRMIVFSVAFRLLRKSPRPALPSRTSL